MPVTHLACFPKDISSSLSSEVLIGYGKNDKNFDTLTTFSDKEKYFLCVGATYIG